MSGIMQSKRTLDAEPLHDQNGIHKKVIKEYGCVAVGGVNFAKSFGGRLNFCQMVLNMIFGKSLICRY